MTEEIKLTTEEKIGLAEVALNVAIKYCEGGAGDICPSKVYTNMYSALEKIAFKVAEKENKS